MLLKTFVATLCVIGVAVADQSPVLLWGSSSPSKPALSTIPQGEFVEIAKTLLESGHMIVNFQEPNLSSKDFQCSIEETKQSCYAHMSGVSQKTYYASVQSPAEALSAATTNQEHNSVDATGKLSTPIKCEAGKVVTITLNNDSKQDRASTLEAHDAVMESISKSLDCPAAFMYMSAPNTAVHSRKRRSPSQQVAGGYLYTEGKQFLLYYTDFLFQGKPVQLNEMTVTNLTQNSFNVSIATSGAHPLVFNINLKAGYYSMNSVGYGDSIFFNSSITAPLGFSYYCGNLTLSNVNTTLSADSVRWNSLQFQAQFGAVDQTKDFVFGDAWHCVGFFTPSILSGLFVVALMLAIVFAGVCWMMDINTMDRFDDPKGKTITINTSE